MPEVIGVDPIVVDPLVLMIERTVHRNARQTVALREPCDGFIVGVREVIISSVAFVTVGGEVRDVHENDERVTVSSHVVDELLVLADQSLLNELSHQHRR